MQIQYSTWILKYNEWHLLEVWVIFFYSDRLTGIKSKYTTRGLIFSGYKGSCSVASIKSRASTVRQNEAIHLLTKSMALRHHIDIGLAGEKHVRRLYILGCISQWSFGECVRAVYTEEVEKTKCCHVKHWRTETDSNFCHNLCNYHRGPALWHYNKTRTVHNKTSHRLSVPGEICKQQHSSSTGNTMEPKDHFHNIYAKMFLQ